MLTPEEKKLFPHADLVRESVGTDTRLFSKLFYRHKIANLLLPDNFIEVTGAQVYPSDDLSNGSIYRATRLFSELAPVNKNHSVFSQHIDRRYDAVMGSKESLCPCDICFSHREFHKSNSLDQRAKQISEEMINIGIVPPYSDPSDYCLTEKDTVIFFEIEHLDHLNLGNYLRALKDLRPNQQWALRVLDRYEKLLFL